MLKVDIKTSITSNKGKQNLELNLEIPTGKIIGIYGASGQGKSTLFNTISGLKNCTVGSVSFNDKVWNNNGKIIVPVQERNVGYLFQEDSLFPHLTVEENIKFALNKKARSETDIKSILEKVDLLGFEKRLPGELSGGQKQRVALARSMVKKSKIILLDEPFTGLDFEMKLKLFELIKSINKNNKTTTLLISHDVADIYSLCSDVIWIKNHCSNKLISVEEFKNQIL